MGATLSADRRYVILVRHASRNLDSDHDESRQSMSGWDPDLSRVKPEFKEKGLPRTLAIAHRLADELKPVKVAQIWHSPHTVAGQTAEAYQWVLSERTKHQCRKEPLASLDPDRGSAETVAEKLAESRTLEKGFALIVVGHQPMLTFLSRELTRKKLPVGTLPLDGSEAACLELHDGKGATLLWMLTEKRSDLSAELKEKIKSKYDVAKFFLGAFVVNTGFVLSGEIWKITNPLAMGLVLAGFVLTLIGLAFTAATLVSYDKLLMPTDFWTSSARDDLKRTQTIRPKEWSVLRPPSQAQVVLFYEMVHVWEVFFIPALACAFAAVAAFLVALAYNHLYPEIRGGGRVELLSLVAIAVVAVAALILPLVLHYRPKRPDLGFED